MDKDEGYGVCDELGTNGTIEEGTDKDQRPHRLVPVREVKTRPVRVQMDDLDILQRLKVRDDETPGMVIHRVLGMYDEFQFMREYAAKLEMEGGERLIKIAALEEELDERMSEIESLREAVEHRSEDDMEMEKLNSIVARQSEKITTLQREIGERMSEIEGLREAAKPPAGDMGEVANLREENRQLNEDLNKMREFISNMVSTHQIEIDERDAMIEDLKGDIMLEDVEGGESVTCGIGKRRGRHSTTINIFIGGGEVE